MRENCEILVFRNFVKFSFSFFCSPRRFGFSVVSTVFSSSRGFSETRFEEGKRSELPPLPFRTPKWISRRARRSRNDRDAISADQVGQTFPRFARLKVLARERERERENPGPRETGIGLSDNYPKRITRGVLPWPASVHTRVF